MSRKERLNEVYEYVRSHFNVHTQSGFADIIRYNRAYISSAMNGNNKYLTDKLFTKICEAYPGVFNLDYLLDGDGSLLMTDTAPMTEHQPVINNPLADIIAAKNETIATQKETIESLQQQIVIQNKLIASLQREIDRIKSSELSLLVADNTEPE